jgi:hypothetical protein
VARYRLCCVHNSGRCGEKLFYWPRVLESSAISESLVTNVLLMTFINNYHRLAGSKSPDLALSSRNYRITGKSFIRRRRTRSRSQKMNQKSLEDKETSCLNDYAEVELFTDCLISRLTQTRAERLEEKRNNCHVISEMVTLSSFYLVQINCYATSCGTLKFVDASH